MITPVMHILSCLNESYSMDSPVDALYLGRTDWELIVSEAHRLGSFFNDENKIWITESPMGPRMVSEVQAVAGKSKSLNPYTALLLTRVWKCYEVYRKEIDTSNTGIFDDDLSTDAVVLRLEGNPRYIFVYVYNIMETPSLSYDAKIAKLKELLITIKNHSVIRDNEPRDAKLRRRLELHSMFSYWKAMLMSDYVHFYGTAPPSFTEETIDAIRSDMNDLGFYGFVNPLQMYQEFNNSRVARKVDVMIDDDVTIFLTKIVLSGGAVVE